MKGKIGVTTENIFPVIKQFLYSDHEIFLRELVANAVDASQKMKALASTGDFKGETGESKKQIRARVSPSPNGCGSISLTSCHWLCCTFSYKGILRSSDTDN